MHPVERIEKDGLVTIIRTKHPDKVPQLVDCLVQGGITLIEITFDVKNAGKLITDSIEKHSPKLSMGAGTILDTAAGQQAILAGASFLVCPHLDVDIIRLAKRYSRLVMPGVMTPTEIMTAWQAGADFVKVFPGHIVGPEFIKAVKGPFPHIRMIPTGKVDETNIAAFFEAGVSAVGLSSCLFNEQILADGDFETVKKNIEKYRKLVDQTLGR
jgi:2-dehydro-3-deoxyphosphogluconate aldolase/(4S)-4-hydroxy-2-oxoglutarate aldolase